MRKTGRKHTHARRFVTHTTQPPNSTSIHLHFRGRRPDLHHSAPKPHTSRNAARPSRLVALATQSTARRPRTSRQIRGRLPDVATRSTFALPEDEPVRSTNSLSTQISKPPPKSHAKPRPSPIRPQLQRGCQGRRLDTHPPSGAAAPASTSPDK